LTRKVFLHKNLYWYTDMTVWNLTVATNMHSREY